MRSTSGFGTSSVSTDSARSDRARGGLRGVNRTHPGDPVRRSPAQRHRRTTRCRLSADKEAGSGVVPLTDSSAVLPGPVRSVSQSVGVVSYCEGISNLSRLAGKAVRSDGGWYVTAAPRSTVVDVGRAQRPAAARLLGRAGYPVAGRVPAQ